MDMEKTPEEVLNISGLALFRSTGARGKPVIL
jgi:hypothetical protein